MKIEDHKIDAAEYTEELKGHNTDKSEWEDNGPRIFNLILVHCPTTLITKMEAQPGYDDCKDNQDIAALLKLIRDITHEHDTTARILVD